MPVSRKKLVLYGIIFALISIVVVQPIFARPPAQDGTERPTPPENNDADRWRNLQYANTPEELLAKAQTQGQIRVIVGLNLSTRFQPEGGMTTSQAQVQRNSVAQARQSLVQSLRPYGATVLAQSDQWSIPFVALRTSAAGLQALQTSSQVSSIQEDHLNFLSNNDDSLLNMGVPPAWANGYDGSGNTVAIIDIGVQASHNFFGGRVVEEYCSSTNDDTYMPELNFISVCPGVQSPPPVQVWGPGAASPAPCAALAAANSFDEECDHGTHVAGIAAGNDSVVPDGVARAANIIAIQVFTYCDGGDVDCTDNSADAVTAFDSNIIAGLNYVYYLNSLPAYQNHIASVNMSLGGGKYNSQAVCDAQNSATKFMIDQLRAVKIATVIASGNEYYGNFIAGPACISSAVSVGSVSDNGETCLPFVCTPHPGKISSFTNTSFMLDLLASGFDIRSSITGPGNIEYGYKDGTSMASPQVAGAWAVVREPLPNATVTQILQAFQATGTPVVDNIRADGYLCIGPCTNLTFKLINVNAAINYLMPSIPVLVTPTGTVMTSAKPTLSWTALHATQYKVFLDTVSPPLTVLTTVNTPSYTLTTPLEPKVYYWQVQALNTLGGVSGLSAISSFSVDVPSIRNYTTDTTPTLTWTPITLATSYEVQIADNSTFTVNLSTYPGIPSTSLSFDVPTPLTIGTHYWRVRALGGTGAYSPAEILVIGS